MATTSGTSVPRIGRITTSGAINSTAVAIAYRALRQLLIHAARKLEIFPGLALIRRSAQQIGRMIRDDERRIQLPEAVHLSAQPPERGFGAEQILGRDAPHCQDDLRPQQLDLSQQIWQTGGDLLG